MCFNHKFEISSRYFTEKPSLFTHFVPPLPPAKQRLSPSRVWWQLPPKTRNSKAFWENLVKSLEYIYIYNIIRKLENPRNLGDPKRPLCCARVVVFFNAKKDPKIKKCFSGYLVANSMPKLLRPHVSTQNY